MRAGEAEQRRRHRARYRVVPSRAWVTLVILLAACSGGPTESGGDATSASPSVMPTPTAQEGAADSSEEPSAVPSASDSAAAPSAGPSGPPQDVKVGDWVVTTADGLRLREDPGLGGTSIGLLRAGYAGTVIEGPVSLDGYEWIRMAWPGLPSGSGCATGPGAGGYLNYCGASGWVATSDERGGRWLEVTRPACPEAPETVRAASQMQPGVRLACFGGEELTLAGFIAPEGMGRGCYPGYDHQPAWLGPCVVAFLQGEESRFDASTYELAVNVHPDLGICQFGGASPEACPFIPYIGRWVRVTGMVDHPSAASCAIEPWEGNETAPDPAIALYACRERFVVTSIDSGTAP